MYDFQRFSADPKYTVGTLTIMNAHKNNLI